VLPCGRGGHHPAPTAGQHQPPRHQCQPHRGGWHQGPGAGPRRPGRPRTHRAGARIWGFCNPVGTGPPLRAGR